MEETNASELAILVLRHQLSTLRRHIKRPTFHLADRSLMAGHIRSLLRNLWINGDARPRPKFLIHDRDAKFSGPFDEVLRSGGVEVI